MGSLFVDGSQLSPLWSPLFPSDSWTFAVSYLSSCLFIRCHNVLFVRGDGLVKLGGYSWLTRADECANYYFPMRARQDGRTRVWHERMRMCWLLPERSFVWWRMDTENRCVCIGNGDYPFCYTTKTVEPELIVWCCRYEEVGDNEAIINAIKRVSREGEGMNCREIIQWDCEWFDKSMMNCMISLRTACSRVFEFYSPN